MPRRGPPPPPRRGSSFLALLLALTRTASTAALLFCGAVAFAQAPVPVVVAPAQPVWVTLLLALGPFIIGALVAIHPLLKLAAFLHARAEDANASAGVKKVFLVGESVAKSLDHFLEANQQDAKDLVDPAKRAAALKHIEDQAKSAALPAIADAANALGSSFVTGAASQAIDAAIAKDTAPKGP